MRFGVPEMQSAESFVTLAGSVNDFITEFSYNAHSLLGLSAGGIQAEYRKE